MNPPKSCLLLLAVLGWSSLATARFEKCPVGLPLDSSSDDSSTSVGQTCSGFICEGKEFNKLCECISNDGALSPRCGNDCSVDLQSTDKSIDDACCPKVNGEVCGGPSRGKCGHNSHQQAMCICNDGITGVDCSEGSAVRGWPAPPPPPEIKVATNDEIKSFIHRVEEKAKANGQPLNVENAEKALTSGAATDLGSKIMEPSKAAGSDSGLVDIGKNSGEATRAPQPSALHHREVVGDASSPSPYQQGMVGILGLGNFDLEGKADTQSAHPSVPSSLIGGPNPLSQLLGGSGLDGAGSGGGALGGIFGGFDAKPSSDPAAPLGENHPVQGSEMTSLGMQISKLFGHEGMPETHADVMSDIAANHPIVTPRPQSTPDFFRHETTPAAGVMTFNGDSPAALSVDPSEINAITDRIHQLAGVGQKMQVEDKKMEQSLGVKTPSSVSSNPNYKPGGGYGANHREEPSAREKDEVFQNMMELKKANDEYFRTHRGQVTHPQDHRDERPHALKQIRRRR